MLLNIKIMLTLSVSLVHSLSRQPALQRFKLMLKPFTDLQNAEPIEESTCNTFVEVYDNNNTTRSDIKAGLNEDLRILDNQMESIPEIREIQCKYRTNKNLRKLQKCFLSNLYRNQASMFEKEQQKVECDEPFEPKCQKPGQVEHGKWICSQDKEVCSVICEPGYKTTSPNPDIQCKKKLQPLVWNPSPDSFSCICGSKPKNPSKGEWLCWSATNGSVECELECFEGYVSNMVSGISCSGSSWSEYPGSFTCNACGGSTNRECPQKPTPPDEVIFITGGAIGQFDSEVVDISGDCGGKKAHFGPPTTQLHWRTGTTAGRKDHKGFLVDNSKLVVCGGRGFGTRFPTIPYSCISSSSPAAGEWRKYKTNFDNNRYRHSGAVVGDSLVLVGGLYEYQHKNTLEILRGDRWLSGTPLENIVGSGSCSVATGNETLIVTGGEVKTRVMEYNIETNAWRILPNMTDRRNSHSCGVVEVRGRKKLVVAGGKTVYLGNQKRADREKSSAVFDLETEEWMDGGDLNNVRQMAEMVLVGGKLVVLGGYEAPNTIEVMRDDYTWKELNIGMVQDENWHFSAVAVPRSLVC